MANTDPRHYTSHATQTTKSTSTDQTSTNPEINSGQCL